MDKSKRIQFLGNELGHKDRDIETAKRILELPMTSVNMYNGSGEKCEIFIHPDLKESLMNFLVDHFNEEKKKTYEELKKELK